VLAALDAAGLADDTLVIFTSDNGCSPAADVKALESQGHFPSAFMRGYKADIWDGGHRVPFIVRWPGHVQAGTTSAFPLTLCDLLPTAASLAGVRAPAATDGLSLQSLLLGGRAPQRGPLYWEFHEGGFVQAVRVGSWKAVRKGLSGAVELYDLKTDLGETRDVSARNRALVRRAEEVMRREHVESEDWPLSGTPASK
jgi:arylsulfatase A-like enzyme